MRRMRTHAVLIATYITAVFAACAPKLNAQDDAAGIRIAAAVTPAVVEIKTTKAAGTGFLVESVGVLLTNDHVASSGDLISVKLSNGEIYNRINTVASDSTRDIAVLRIPGFNLPTLRLGESDGVQVGQRVFIVGNPLGLENTLTDGVVSAVRQFDGVRLFQVSAPISPGSSGSPVLNLNGEVIGIAVSKWRGGENLNFAVPINYARGLISLAPGTPASSPIIPTRAVGADAASLSGIWKSLVSGYEMKIREDGDRLYVEFIYSAEERQLGLMSIYDLKQPTTGVNTYTGTFRRGGYCKDFTGRAVSRFSFVTDVELRSTSSQRIEGRVFVPKPTWNPCNGKQPNDKDKQWTELVWIRK